MPNLRRLGGTYKGLIGEIMFVSSNTQYILPRFHPKNKYLGNMELDNEKRRFLDENWYSIDAISYDGKYIIEIKTRNSYSGYLPYKPKASQKSIQILVSAAATGFAVSVATVWFKENWEFEIEVKPFKSDELHADSKKRYDGAFRDT